MLADSECPRLWKQVGNHDLDDLESPPAGPAAARPASGRDPGRAGVPGLGPIRVGPKDAPPCACTSHGEDALVGLRRY